MSIYDVSGNDLKNIYTKIGANTNLAYTVDGTPLSAIPFDDNTSVDIVFSTTLSKTVQAGCVDDYGYAYLCFYYQCFLKVDIENGTDVQYPFASGAYGHGNGMCYNPNTDRICVAPMLDTGEIYVLDRSLNLVNTYTAKKASGEVFNCWNIAYDRLENRYVMLHDAVYYFDDNFDFIEAFPYDQSHWGNTKQDIETDGEYIYCITFGSPCKITVYDMQGNFVKVINNSDFSRVAHEPESLMYDWVNDKFYIEGRTSEGAAICSIQFKN